MEQRQREAAAMQQRYTTVQLVWEDQAPTSLIR